MNFHEYQAKELLLEYGLPIPDFFVASTVDEVEKNLSFEEAVVKVQVHAGGRGKAGGVKFGKSREEIVEHAKNLIGMNLVTKQTGKAGINVEKVLIADPVTIEKEYYVAALIDRSLGQPILMISPDGGMEIEESDPAKILQLPFSNDGKLRRYQLIELTKWMGWSGDIAKQGAKIFSAIAKAFIESDASLIEINPLVLTKEEQLSCIDAKVSVDDDALFRHKFDHLYDPSQQDPKEVEAKKHDLAYIGLDGTIGCLVNGAGLAMATMDIIHYYGGEPANFLDVGGGATEEQVAKGFQIILSDPNVKTIFVNIFGGIMDCGVLAKGIVHATKEMHLKVPLVVRMEGTNVEVGRKVLAESGLNIVTADTMAEGAIKAVEL
ncbi:MAG: Succinate--CoA ligase [ADP-forming] subunit beta [Chlamydiales bacterium]|nr:Succinate--CoA ligase [ADP-forming] subunit beta [Chlamydiales bacterium]MCH9635572.1 Succinate--CoA ligase [ADP-forming] subunit beta [Chlamydiales bacterium]MCH9703524.1 ADP-forming succinate--CoA ligase subunit beta [Chlamydiota bacterium]